MDTSGRALVDFWAWAVKERGLNANTATGLRAACSKVVAAIDGWDQDVRALDVESALARFVERCGEGYTPGSLETYQRRFRQALRSFLEWAEDPEGWMPAHRKSRAAAGGDELTTYQFPLRGDVMVTLSLPRDVTSAEMNRLLAWARTLAIDFSGDAE